MDTAVLVWSLRSIVYLSTKCTLKENHLHHCGVCYVLNYVIIHQSVFSGIAHTPLEIQPMRVFYFIYLLFDILFKLVILSIYVCSSIFYFGTYTRENAG